MSEASPGRDPPLSDARYTLLEKIGQGAVGTVYRARDYAGGYPRDVCIKRLHGPLANEHVAALEEEARLLSSVRHANVVSLLAVGQDAMSMPFLVLELISGMDLRALCRHVKAQPAIDWGGYLPDALCVHVACGILRGLAAVQRAVPGLVHRDVTPHNVLLSREGEIKLADFGIALAQDRVRWTRPALVKGKYGYMSPEQIRGEGIDVRSDLFATGVLLYELLARERPWGGMQGMDELVAIEHGAAVGLALHRPRLDRSLVAVVERMISHDADERWGSPDDTLRALAPFGAGEAGSLRLASLVRVSEQAKGG